MTENKAIEKLDKGLTVTQREVIDRLVSGDCNGRIVAIAEDMGIPNPRRFVFELTARPETAMLARAYLAAKLTETAFEAVEVLAGVVRGEDGGRDESKPLEQMSPDELQQFIEAKQAERRKLELQASKAEDLKASQAQPIERAADAEPLDIFGD